MKTILFLLFCLLSAGCATKPSPTVATSEPAPPSKESPLVLLDKVKIGMSRSDAERILGEPTSITDTASGTTDVWVFATKASEKALPPEANDNSALYSQIGSIAATTAGIFIPYAGVIGTIGSQVYSVSNTPDQNAPKPTQAANSPLIVTIEFRENKVFSIQRAKPAEPAPAIK